MNRRTFDVNAASMVGLKAELYRKREEARHTAAGGTAKEPAHKSAKKTPLWARQNRGVTSRAAKDRPEPSDGTEDLLARSRQALEAKSRLYDELSRSKLPLCSPDDDNGFLVDFERKAEAKEEEDDEKEEWDEREEEWVEYEDVFGRLRRCLRDELPHHLARNDELRERLTQKEEKDSDQEEKEEDREGREERELREEEEEAAAPSKLELHYADVQQAEIRQHGVGFYALSGDAKARQEQMDQLQKLREDTDKNRERSARIREKRKAALEMRLAKVKQRRAAAEVKIEKDEEEDEKKTEGKQDEMKEEEQQVVQNEAAIASKLSELRAQAELLKPRPATKRREWDRGKAMLSAEKYLEQRRAERSSKFAPPSNYFR